MPPPFQLILCSRTGRGYACKWIFTLLILSAGIFSIDARAVRLSHRIQGGYYLIQVMPEASYPVDCQISWQVRMSDFTRQGQAYLTDVSGAMWSEATGPMTQDVQTIGYSARCQISDKETQRRAIDAERERVLQEQQAALLRQRRQTELERQKEMEREQEKEKQRRNEAATAARQKDDAAEIASRTRSGQAQEAARQRMQMQQRQADERRAAQQREQAQRQAEKEAALAREQQRQQQLARRREAMSGVANMATDSLNGQVAARDQELSSIAQGASGRTTDIRQESAAAARTNQPTQQEMHDYLLQGLGQP